MNRDDLMNALSGLDPKFIDEAALELHEDSGVQPAMTGNRNDNPVAARKASIRRFMTVALPAAAAILITVTVALPLIKNTGRHESTAPSYSESAAPASDAGMYGDAEAAYEASEEPVYDEDAAPAYESAEAPAYESEEAPAYDEAMSPSENVSASGGANASIQADETGTDTEEKTGSADALMPAIASVSYDDGILTVESSGPLPDDISDWKYKIAEADDDDTEMIIAEGLLGDIMTDTDPLVLNIADLNLKQGTYSLSIGEESTEFTVR